MKTLRPDSQAVKLLKAEATILVVNNGAKILVFAWAFTCHFSAHCKIIHSKTSKQNIEEQSHQMCKTVFLYLGGS